jgi:pimeloyl-ACP methyl ester carboxylesterase
MYSTAKFLSDYGEVYLPDLPGIGGMNSFYTIKMTPTLDNYAHYLYSFLKLKKLDKNIEIVAMSFGFMVVSRMLQLYPDSQKWFNHVISYVGFGRSSDFKNFKLKKRYYTPVNKIFSTKIGSIFIKIFIFNPFSLKIMFRIFRQFNPKYQHGMKKDLKASTDMELDLWTKNDARTRFFVYNILFNFDLTKSVTKIGVRLHNMTTPHDQYFDSERVKVSLSKIYRDVTSSTAKLEMHAPSIIGTKQEVSAQFSDETKEILN